MEGSTAANPIIVDDEEDKENSAPTTTTTTTTPESERPTEPPRLLRSRLDWKKCLNPYTGLCFVNFCI